MKKNSAQKKATASSSESTTKHAWESYNPAPYISRAPKGLSEDLIRMISKEKNEPLWMLEHRLKCLKLFYDISLPKWGPDLSRLDLDKIIYYAKASDRQARDWDEVPRDIKKTFDRLGIPQAEQEV